ncbi:N-acetyltransferase family protein [Celerinatantimonas sp. YJH-8]|uniref:GNAT family N-acetyltransferase n=1 Tax=Celerinatantimonas sp. YJH-8 TaxID=3228714 RepID=UPI0038C0F5E8
MQFSDYTVRQAQFSDLEAIVAIYNSTVASRQVTADLEPVTVEARIPWFNEHEHAGRPVYVVLDTQGQVQGWFSFSAFYGRDAYRATCEISIYLAPECRGKGWGTRLLTDAEAIAQTLQINVLLAVIFSHNIPSIRLFQKCNYQHWGELPKIAEMEQQLYSVTLMGKRID